MQSEVWKQVLGYPNYEVSNHGQVRSINRETVTKTKSGGWKVNKMKGRVIKQFVSHRYPRVTLSLEGRLKSRLVHNLVCETFHGPRPDGMFALHIDDNPFNAHADNLYWGTAKTNWQDRITNAIERLGV